MLKKFELHKTEKYLVHKCQRNKSTIKYNYWDNIYMINRKDPLHIYCKACPIKLPIFYTIGFKIKKGFDNEDEYILIGEIPERIYEKISNNIIEYEIEIC